LGRSGLGLIERLATILRKSGHKLTVAPTTGPATAGPIAREHVERGADLIIAAGGDGTINEVAEGVVYSRAALAVLPLGTANCLAVEMGLPRKPERAAEALETCRPRRIAAGRLECDGGRVQRHFLLMAGVGLDAHVVYRLDASLKNRTGKFAYWVAAWSMFGRSLPEFDVEIDGRKIRSSFALFSRVRNYGGDFQIAPSVSLYDNNFEAVLFKGRSSLRYAKYFLGMALRRLEGMRGVTILRTDRIRLFGPSDSRIYVQIDGEFAGPLPAEVQILPDAITLMVPEQYGS
jgi:diacylglycerol kinase family enzyme